MGPQTRPAVVPVTERINEADMLSNWQNPHTGGLTCGVRAIMVGKAKWEPSEWLLPRKTVNQNAAFPGDCRDQCHRPGLERRGVEIPTSPFNPRPWPVPDRRVLENDGGSVRVGPGGAAAPDVAALFEHVNTAQRAARSCLSLHLCP